jgi:hypothetical protein
VERSLTDISLRQRASIFFASGLTLFSKKEISAVDHPPYCPDFWLFPDHKSVLGGKCISDVKSSVKNISTDISLRNFKDFSENLQLGTV